MQVSNVQIYMLQKWHTRTKVQLFELLHFVILLSVMPLPTSQFFNKAIPFISYDTFISKQNWIFKVSTRIRFIKSPAAPQKALIESSYLFHPR